jgi:hypothetical protein
MPRDLDLTKRSLWENHGARYKDEQSAHICAAPMLSSIHVSDLNLRTHDRAVTGEPGHMQSESPEKLYAIGKFTGNTSLAGVLFRIRDSSNADTTCPLGISR